MKGIRTIKRLLEEELMKFVREKIHKKEETMYKEETTNTQNLTPYYVYGFWNNYKDKPLVTDENYKPEIRIFGDINAALSFMHKRIEKNTNITWCITSNLNNIE